MTDKGTVRIVVVFIGIITLVLISGAIFLVSVNKTVPDPIWTLAGGSLGAFSAMLVSTRTANGATPVNVVNPPANPVPVEPVP